MSDSLGFESNPLAAPINRENLPFPVWANFEFTGKGTEYFKIWIVNIVLSIVTLGIYSAWAKFRKERYFYGNTWVNGSSFIYTAEPVKILKGRLIAFVFFAAFGVVVNFFPVFSFYALTTLCVLFPFMLVTSTAFRLRNSMYRNMRFRFDRDYLDAYKIFVVPLAIILVTTAVFYGLFAGSEIVAEMEKVEGADFRKEDTLISIFFLAAMPFVPLIIHYMRKFIVNRTHYGSADGHFLATVGKFYAIFIKFIILSVLVFMLLGLLTIPILGFIFSGTPTLEEINIEPRQLGSVYIAFFTLGLVFYGVSFFTLGYLKSRLTNTTLNNTELGPILIESSLRARDLGWLYLSNTVAIMLSVGFLIPWAQIRMARYKAAQTQLLAKDMNAINSIEQDNPSAFGEELGEFFDFDFGL